MRNVRNYIEELTDRVERAKESGLNVAEMQKQITADSLKSLASNGYGASLTSAMTAGLAHFGGPRRVRDAHLLMIRNRLDARETAAWWPSSNELSAVLWSVIRRRV